MQYVQNTAVFVHFQLKCRRILYCSCAAVYSVYRIVPAGLGLITTRAATRRRTAVPPRARARIVITSVQRRGRSRSTPDGPPDGPTDAGREA